MKRLVLFLLSACSDPTRDHQIERLGGEDPAVQPGPEHRPGQPCVLCHSAGGPASDHPFVVGGTIFETDAPNSPGADKVEIRFVDARSNGPRDQVFTNAVGNFYVEESSWDVTYPFRVGIYKNKKLVAEMSTTVNRDGSCATCHTPLVPGDGDLARMSVGQIYVKIGGSK